MKKHQQQLGKGTVFNWFSRYEDQNEQSNQGVSKHFPIQTNTHPDAKSQREKRVSFHFNAGNTMP